MEYISSPPPKSGLEKQVEATPESGHRKILGDSRFSEHIQRLMLVGRDTVGELA